MPRLEQYIAGIDIGSSKVGVLIGKATENEHLEIVGRGHVPYRGTRRGNVVNVDATVAALKAACEEAEVMAGVEIASAYVGIAGLDMRAANSSGMVSVARKDREIVRQDIQRVLEAAQSVALPADREILHAIPQEFIVDEQGGIADPLGMLGSRLEVAVHLVSCQETRSKTLLTCVNRAGIAVEELVFEPLATGEAVLSHDERELGALLVDIGDGTTSFAYYADGEVRQSGVVPISARHFTTDLAAMLKSPFPDAERLKREKGCCLASMVGDDEGVSVPSVGGAGTRVVPKRHLCEILQPRAEELFELIHRELARLGNQEGLRAGVVLTGGGAQLEGLLELAEQAFGCSVRYGIPDARLGGLVDVISCPTWCTASGLLLYGRGAANRKHVAGRKQGLTVRHVVGSIKSLFSDLL